MQGIASAVGFVGLGNIGSPIARNLAERIASLVAYDSAGTRARLPANAQAADGIGDLARRCGITFLSLPNGDAVASVVTALVASNGESLRTIIDLSTIGVRAARAAAEHAGRAGVDYLDAPVSGGVAGAAVRNIAVMCAGARAAFDEAASVLEAISSKVFYVGTKPGQGQALKLLNNFLSATALAATSEAVEFGLRHDLAMDVMLEVLNASSGRNSATADKFPNQIATRRYAGGFRNTLMGKDINLYLAEARDSRCEGPIADLIGAIWRSFNETMPAQDFTRIFDYVRGKFPAVPDSRGT